MSFLQSFFEPTDGAMHPCFGAKRGNIHLLQTLPDYIQKMLTTPTAEFGLDPAVSAPKYLADTLSSVTLVHTIENKSRFKCRPSVELDTTAFTLEKLERQDKQVVFPVNADSRIQYESIFDRICASPKHVHVRLILAIRKLPVRCHASQGDMGYELSTTTPYTHHYADARSKLVSKSSKRSGILVSLQSPNDASMYLYTMPAHLTRPASLASLSKAAAAPEVLDASVHSGVYHTETKLNGTNAVKCASDCMFSKLNPVLSCSFKGCAFVESDPVAFDSVLTPLEYPLFVHGILSLPVEIVYCCL